MGYVTLDLLLVALKDGVSDFSLMLFFYFGKPKGCIRGNIMDKENNFFSEYFEALIQNESFKQLFLMKHNHTLKISQEDIDKLDLGEYQFLVYYHKYSAQQVR